MPRQEHCIATPIYQSRAGRPTMLLYIVGRQSMRIRLLAMSLVLLAIGIADSSPARADIYTWTDAGGNVNVSNVAPVGGIRVTSVLRTSAAETAARDAARHDAEVQALADRVRQLEADAALAQRQPSLPPQIEYRAAAALPAPPIVQYIFSPGPSAASASTSLNYGCDSAQQDCGLWQLREWYPTSVLIVRSPRPRHFQPVRGGHQISVQRPHMAGELRRG